MHVDARLKPNDNVTANQFHGFHIHANNDPANGQGCVADPAAAKSTWFVSADGHLSEGQITRRAQRRHAQSAGHG